MNAHSISISGGLLLGVSFFLYFNTNYQKDRRLLIFFSIANGIVAAAMFYFLSFFSYGF
jgi:hypothetical protein